MATLNEQADRVGTNTRQAAEKAQGFAAMVESTTHNLGSKISDSVADLTDRADDYVGYARKYVKGNPIQSVLMAAGAGAVIGGLIALATKSRD